jgi:hypothetical protein
MDASRGLASVRRGEAARAVSVSVTDP